MTTDSGSPEPMEKGQDLWSLPTIISLEIVHVRYKKPIEYFIKSKLVQIGAATEFLVKTSQDFPIRALSPALFVGDVPVTEGTRLDKNLYRFVVPGPDSERLKAGTPISIGWAGVKAKKMTTNFQFQIQREENR